MTRFQTAGVGLVLTLLGSPATNGAVPQEAAKPATSSAASASTVSDAGPLKTLNEGPVHESFLSPRKDVDPIRIATSPPAALIEHPAVAPPSNGAAWIEGYWEWDAGRHDFVWVTGTWRIAPPGRFWVNGFWKHDDKGWFRVPGFWSDQKSDRIDYREKGPPADRPVEDPGEPPSSTECFYIPGQYYPNGKGVVWRKGFWTRVQPGWSWVPASWIRQPEGWIFQEGYWDRSLEDRGILFAPVLASADARVEDLVYEPYTIVSPEIYGQLYGAFGRPNPAYDGYPGVSYDDDGRFYAYANYGTLSGYYGYLDYPFYGVGYPYYAAPLAYPMYRRTIGFPVVAGALGLAFGSPIYSFLPAWGNVGWGGLGNWGIPGWGLAGLGWAWSGPTWGSTAWGGLGWGFPMWGNAGYGWGWSGPTWGSPSLNGIGWGLPFLGNAGFGFGGWSGPAWGSPLWGPFGSPYWGGGFGWGFPFLGFINVGSGNCFPFQNTGQGHHVRPVPNPAPPNGGHPTGGDGGANGIARHLTTGGVAGPRAHGVLPGGGPGLASVGLNPRRGVQPPPASRPFANLESHHAARPSPASGPLQHAGMRNGPGRHGVPSIVATSGNWDHAFNREARAAAMRHAVARPVFTHADGGPGASGRLNPRTNDGLPGPGPMHQRAVAGGGLAGQGLINPHRADGGTAGRAAANPGAGPAFAAQMRNASGVGAHPGLAARAHAAASASNAGVAGPGRHPGQGPMGGRIQNLLPQSPSFAPPLAGGGAAGAPFHSPAARNLGAMRGGPLNPSGSPGGGLHAGGMHAGNFGSGGMNAGDFGGGGMRGGMRSGGFGGGMNPGGFGGGGLRGGMSAGRFGGGGMNAGMHTGGFGGGMNAGMHTGGFGGGMNAGMHTGGFGGGMNAGMHTGGFGGGGFGGMNAGGVAGGGMPSGGFGGGFGGGGMHAGGFSGGMRGGMGGGGHR